MKNHSPSLSGNEGGRRIWAGIVIYSPSLSRNDWIKCNYKSNLWLTFSIFLPYSSALLWSNIYQGTIKFLALAMTNFSSGPSSSAVINEAFAPNRTLFNSKDKDVETDVEKEQKARSDALLKKIVSLPASPAERATLYALMNHLKKVSLHSDANKMICQNLAVCFGPVLLGPVTSPTTK